MAHNITKTDSALYHAKPAWHGLGIVVQDAPTPREALKIAGLGWRVIEQPLRRMVPVNDGQMLGSCEVTSHKAIVREDNNEQLGIQGKDWTPVQNEELADLAEQLNQDGIVKVESCGSLSGGRKVWILLKGESVFVTGRDEVQPFVLLANGHDGSLSLTIMATTVRVECENKLNIALGQRNERAIRYVHSKGIKASYKEAQLAIGMFIESRQQFEAEAKALRAHSMKIEDVREFWLDVYTRVLDLDLPTAEKAKQDKSTAYNRAQAIERMAQWERNWKREIEQRDNVPSAWAAFNAVTEEFGQRETGDQGAVLFGTRAQRRKDVFKAALALV